MATTGSPTSRLALEPRVAGVRPEARAWIRAMSSDVDAPTSSALAVEPSLNRTEISPPAPSITWALVRIRPSSEMTTPEPAPPNTESGPPVWMVTTDGRAMSSSAWMSRSPVARSSVVVVVSSAVPVPPSARTPRA